MKILVTGAAGFIGRRVCAAYHETNYVIGLDSMVRASGPMENCAESYVADVRNVNDLPLPNVDAVIHLAAQVAVTRSVTSPMHDFGTNALGTLTMALWAREHADTFVYASTNKVFGRLEGRTHPVGDATPIAPVTPYGISKATGDLYVTDLLKNGYSFRQSCIYGPDQRGSVDQGWAAYVRRMSQAGVGVTCYGDGTQVRDLLHVDDLIAAYTLAIDGMDLAPGAYVVGGGAGNALSFATFVGLCGGHIRSFEDWRPGDQRYFVSANDGLAKAGWHPRVGVGAAVGR
jgi:CDP-paratose 2-epimerase